MPTDEYALLYNTDIVSQVSEDKEMWSEFCDFHYYITWDNIKCIARRILSSTDFRVFVLRGERGMYFYQISQILDLPTTTIYENFLKNVKKVRDFVQKSRIERVYIGREKYNGFKEYVMAEKELSKRKFAAVCKRCNKHIVDKGWLIEGGLYHEDCKELYVAEKGSEGSEVVMRAIYLG